MHRSRKNGAGAARPLLIAGAVLLTLTACGKKPDFPVPPEGTPPVRLYPDPTLDPGYKAPPAAMPRPVPGARVPIGRPAPAPSDVPGVDDLQQPTDPEAPPPGITAEPQPGAPADSAIPPGIASPTPGQ